MSFVHFEPTPTLYLFLQDGCGSCAEAEPHWRRVQREYPTKVMFIPLHVNRKDWNIHGWRPRGTPGYALVVGGRLVKKHVGVLEYAGLKEWLGELLQ
jgi:hypothetical protein